MRPIAVRLLGAAVALVLGFVGTRWGAQGAPAAIAALAIALIAVEQQLEARKGCRLLRKIDPPCLIMCAPPHYDGAH